MKFLSILIILILFSFNSYAEKCEGIHACAELYTKLTGDKVTVDTSVTDEMSLAVSGVELTAENAKNKFEIFLNKNVVALTAKKQLVAGRKGDFLTAPVYVVSEGNIPRMINKDGPVTFVYQAKNETKKLINNKTRGLLSRKKGSFETMINTFDKTKIIAVSDKDENASRIITFIMKSDK